MSAKLMVKAMHVKVGNPIAKLVLIKLAENAKDDGKCWPSYQHIASFCECSKNSVRNHINNLEKMGLLRKEKRNGYRNGKGNASNVYYLTLDSAEQIKTEETINIAPPSDCDKPTLSNNVIKGHEMTDPMPADGIALCQEMAQPPYANTWHTLCQEMAPEPVRETVTKEKDQNPCQAGKQPDDLAAPAEQVLGYFNQTTDSSYRDGKTTMGYIRGRLAEGYTAEDLMLVVDYLTAKWLNDPKMSDYLRPRTLFSPENCAEYFDKAKKWTKNGRPACINGKWQSGSAPRKDVLDFNNTDWIYGIQDTLLSAGVGA